MYAAKEKTQIDSAWSLSCGCLDLFESNYFRMFAIPTPPRLNPQPKGVK